MIAVIIGTAVVINVVYQQLDSGSTCASGTTLTILRMLPLMVAIILLVAIVGVIR